MNRLAIIGALAVLVFGVSLISAGLTPQLYILLLLSTFAAIVWRAQSALIAATVTVCVVGLVRRLLTDGRQDTDPLVLAALLLMILAIAYSEKRADGPRDNWQRLGYVTAAGLVLATVFNRQFGIPFLFTLAIECAMLFIIVGVRGGSLPDVWNTVERVLPPVGVVIAAYGIAQFFLLPSWDKDWMVASKLQTIGDPEPLELRVFGTAESPASFAALLSAALLVSIIRIRKGNNPAVQLLLILGMGVLAFAIVLTGVRSALLGLAIALVWMSVTGKGGPSRVIPVLIACVGGYFVVQVVDRFGSDSTVLSADRLTQFSAGSDLSAQTRLDLIRTIPDSMLFPLGRGAIGTATGVSNLDNMFVDFLWKAGPFVALAIVVLCLKVLADAWILRSDPSATGAASVSVFFLVYGLSLNPFATTNGLIAALAFGAVMRRAWLLRRDRAIAATQADRKPLWHEVEVSS